VTPDSRGPTGAWAPDPLLLWCPATARSRKGSTAPVVAFKVARAPCAALPIRLKKPPMNSRSFGNSSMVSMPPFVDGALNDDTARPVLTLISWRWFGPTPLIFVKSPAT
jgi:hypothetical protein